MRYLASIFILCGSMWGQGILAPILQGAPAAGGGHGAFVQFIHGYPSTQYTFASGNTAGDFIFSCVSSNSTSVTFTVGDDQGNTYQTIQYCRSNQGQPVTVACSYAMNIASHAAGNKVTWTPTGGSDDGGFAYEMSGIATTSALDGSPTCGQSTASATKTPITGSFSTTATDTIFAAMGDETAGQGAITPGAILGTTATMSGTGNPTTTHADASEYVLNQASGTGTAAMSTVNNSSTWIIYEWAFKSP